jgi:hypothetical protein
LTTSPGQLPFHDAAKAKAAYQDFLTLWKDADPDIPILREAKAEYAKLQSLREAAASKVFIYSEQVDGSTLNLHLL